jgi:hypothetical protein
MNLWILILELFMKLLELTLKINPDTITLDSGKKWSNNPKMAKAFSYSTPLKRLLAALGKRDDAPETLGEALDFLKSRAGRKWLSETF